MSNKTDVEFGTPLDISDIINVCRAFNQLGHQMQAQVENILEIGVDAAIKEGLVKREALPHIKEFLEQISNNFLFGDAQAQAYECIDLIKQYEENCVVNLFDVN